MAEAKPYKKPLPRIDEETRGFWEALARHELYLQRCRKCGTIRFYPRAVCPVELAEGPRLMTNIVECAPDTVRIGTSVEVVFDDVTPEVTLPKFRPVA